MNEREQLRQARFEREKLVMRYADALEQGDLDMVALILDRAETDPELERSLWEMQVALGEMLQEEERARMVEVQRQNEEHVTALVKSHFETTVTQTPPPPEKPRALTVGDLVATIRHHLGQDPVQKERLKSWANSEEPAVIPRGEREVRTLLERFGVQAPVKSLVSRIHEALLALAMQRQGPEVRLAAARRQNGTRERPETPDKTAAGDQSPQPEGQDRTEKPSVEEQP